MQRPVVVLPQPLSPTSLSVSPRRTEKSMPSTAFTSPILRCNDDAFGDREVHPQPPDFEEGWLVVRGYGHCRYLSSQMVAKS
jgi:hypothetical protein